MKVAVRDQTKSNKGQCSAPEIYLSGSQNSIQLIFLVKITFKTLMGTKSPQFIFCVKIAVVNTKENVKTLLNSNSIVKTFHLTMKARSELRLKRAIYEISTMPMCAMGRALGRRKVRVDWTRGSDESWGREKSGTVVAKYTCNIQI